MHNLILIHNISDCLLQRKSVKWKLTKISNFEYCDCDAIYENAELTMSDILTKVINHKIKPALMVNYSSNLYSIKKKLELDPWPIPYNITEEEHAIFMQDLNFYLMISGILLKINEVFSGFISNNLLPSTIQVLPIFTSHKRLINHSINHLKANKWLQTIHNNQVKNKYILLLDSIKLLSQSRKISQEIRFVLSEILREIHISPINKEHEVYKISKLTIIKETINLNFDLLAKLTKENWHFHRVIFANAILILNLQDNVFQKYSDYINEFAILEDFDFEEEIYFLKYYQKNHKLNSKKLPLSMINSFYSFDFLINSLNNSKLNIQRVSSPRVYLEWNENPKEFVKKIQPLIAKGYLTLKGSADIAPIVKFISCFVKIKKQNKSGDLNNNSLLTYFKKANSDDL